MYFHIDGNFFPIYFPLLIDTFFETWEAERGYDNILFLTANFYVCVQLDVDGFCTRSDISCIKYVSNSDLKSSLYIILKGW